MAKIRKPNYRPYNVGEYRLGWLRGQFAAVWYEDGHRKRYQLGVKTETEARTALHEFVEHRTKKSFDPTPTLDVIFEQYVADREAEGVQVKKLRWKWVPLRPAFGHLRPQDITKALCREFAEGRSRQGRMPNSIETELRQLRTVVNWAFNEKLITEKPGIHVPRAPEPRHRYLTRTEVERLLQNAEHAHVRLFIVVAITTAARMKAILDLTWDRVDFQRGLIYLHDPSQPRTSKGRAIVPMNDSARAHLQEAKLASVTPYVIEWGGQGIKNIRRSIDTALKRAGLKQEQDGAHLLRHTSAVFMAEAGVPMSEISQYLGHSSTDVTERVYARYSPEYLRGAARALNMRGIHAIIN